ncbi:MAG: SAM-dependent methyltransferase [Acidimicrobiales bacterium]|nr:SAM-dependent methyltransferase [Acidimicrobiales bacterium]
MGLIDDRLAARIRRVGPIGFDELMEAALYDSEVGFYETGGQAGRRGDFVTSPEIGPLFGAVVARALDDWWAALGEPNPFVVIEAGAGRGALAAAVRAANPRCAPALTYVLVDRSAWLRERQREHLELTAPEFALPPSTAADNDGAAAVPAAGATGRGPRFVSLPELPAVRIQGVVLANELLDNVPCRLLERTGTGWSEVQIGLTDGQLPLAEHLTPVSEELEALANRLAPDARPGARIPLQRQAADWLKNAFGVLEAGWLVIIDYATSTAALAERQPEEWLRTYRGHERGGPPLTDLGRQDITAEVCTDQLARVRSLSADESQAEFLTRFGIDELVAEGRRIWADRAHVGDLEAVKARSRVREAEALLDPAGLGGFRVLTWHV